MHCLMMVRFRCCPSGDVHVQSSLVLLEEGVCYDQCIFLAKLYQSLPCFIPHSKAKFACYSWCFLISYFCIRVPCNEKDIFLGVSSKRSCRSSQGEGNGTPLQYSCLENPMNKGAWQAAVHGVAQSWTRLSDFTFTFHFHALEKEMAIHSSVLAWRIPQLTGNIQGLTLGIIFENTH